MVHFDDPTIEQTLVQKNEKKKEIHSDINKAELGNGNIQCP